MSHEAIYERVTKACGGAGRLAALVGVGANVASNWNKRGIPAGLVCKVSQVSGVSIQELRPNDWQNFVPVVAPARAKKRVEEGSVA